MLPQREGPSHDFGRIFIEFQLNFEGFSVTMRDRPSQKKQENHEVCSNRED